MAKRSFKFWIGVILLVTNQPIGWGGIAICTALALKTGKKGFYGALAGIIYTLSWGLLFLGGWLAGPEGIQMVKQTFAKLKNLWRSKKN